LVPQLIASGGAAATPGSSSLSPSPARWSRWGAPYWLLLLVALTGALSTDVVDNGPATTLEQVMLAAEDAGTSRVYARYNAVGAAAGALGALAATLPGLGRHGAGAGGYAGGTGDTVVITAWPSHAVFDAWIATPHRDALTASDVHNAVTYQPITRYEVPGGYLNLPGLTAHDPTTRTEETS